MNAVIGPVMHNREMPDRICHHCKDLVREGEEHDCWTTTEAALTRHLPEELREAWERLRETAASFGDQRIYASHKSIMFSRACCYFFVRPKMKFLEVCVFLGRPLKAPEVRRVDQASKSKIVNIIHITHRDQVESPITDWLREAYALSETKSAKPAKSPSVPAPAKKKTNAARATSPTAKSRKRR